MDIRIETRFENIGRGRWNALVFQNETNTIFQTYEWHLVWWQVFGDDKELFVISIKEGDTLVGIAPLMICKNKGSRRVLRFISHGESDYSDFIYLKGKRKILNLFFGFIREQSSRWDEIELNNVPSHTRPSGIIKNICKDEKLYCLKSIITLCPVLLIKDDPDFTQVVRNKKSLRRHQNYFLKRGKYKVMHLTDGFEIAKYLVPFFQQHIKRWSGTNTQSLFLDQKKSIFYKQLVSTIVDNQWLIFTVLESEDIAIAFHFGFAYNKKFIWYKPSFEISLAKHSPGEVLLKELLDFAAISDFDEFDFTVGDEAFKMRFANERRETISYRIFKKLGKYWFYNVIGLLKKNMRKHKMGKSIIAFAKRVKENIYSRSHQDDS